MKITVIGLLTIWMIGMSSLNAQTYTRGKKNIGFTIGGANTLVNTNSQNFTSENGYSFNAGLSKRLFRVVYPSIIYKYTDNKSSGLYHSVSLPVLAKLPFWGIYLGKSKRYECKGVDLGFIIGPEYSFNFGDPPAYYGFSNEFFLDAGLQLVPSRSGGSKNNQKWSFHIDLIYKHGLSSYMKTDVYPDETWKAHRIAIQLTLFKYRINKFSNM